MRKHLTPLYRETKNIFSKKKRLNTILAKLINLELSSKNGALSLN